MQKKAASVHGQQEFLMLSGRVGPVSPANDENKRKGGYPNTSGFCFCNLNWKVSYAFLMSTMQEHFNPEHGNSVT